MSYSLRSRREPSPHLSVEQTVTSVSNSTELQTTANFPQAVLLQLDQPQDSKNDIPYFRCELEEINHFYPICLLQFCDTAGCMCVSDKLSDVQRFVARRNNSFSQ